MKVLIWIGCIIVATILNTLLGYATGIKAGYIVFYIAVYFVAKKLGNKWDEHKEAKEAQENATAPIYPPFVDAAINTVDEICFCRKCGEKLIDSSQYCRKCGTEVLKELDDLQ